MIINRTDAVKLLVDLAFASAPEWDDAKVLSKIKLVPEKVSADDVSAPFRSLLKELIDANGDIKLSGVEEKEGKEEKKKEKVEVPTDAQIDGMDKASIRALIEERGLDIKVRARDSIADVKSKLKKLLALAKGKEAKPAKAAKVKKESKELVEKDKYGCRVGTIRAQTNVAFSRKWKTIAEIEEETGVPPGKIAGNLADQVKSGLLEVQKVEGKNQFRLAKAA